jgi:hypothetical protein
LFGLQRFRACGAAKTLAIKAQIPASPSGFPSFVGVLLQWVGTNEEIRHLAE